MDTDDGATDSAGDPCAEYMENTHWCGGYDDDDFDSMQMCCGCDGGSTVLYRCTRWSAYDAGTEPSAEKVAYCQSACSSSAECSGFTINPTGCYFRSGPLTIGDAGTNSDHLPSRCYSKQFERPSPPPSPPPPSPPPACLLYTSPSPRDS